MRVILKIWRQASPHERGALVTYPMDDVSPDISFLEMLDQLNEQLIQQGQGAIAFDSDCREGICGTCGFVVNGVAHGPESLTTVCQLYMRHFRDGDTLVVEPFRSRAFPIVKDLVIDRRSFDRIIELGGYISVRTGGAPEANSILVSKQSADRAMDAAACIGCGACIAACPNGSAMLFTAAKISHLGSLPQGQPERRQRALRLVNAMLEMGFGSCTNHGECEAVCPKGISLDFIAQLNRDYLRCGLIESARPVERV